MIHLDFSSFRQRLPFPSVRLHLFLLFVLFLLAAGCGEKPGNSKPVHIGIINPSANLEAVVDGFKAGMTAHGYREGEEVVYHYTGPFGSNSVFEQHYRALEQKGINLLYALTQETAAEARKAAASKGLPIVVAPMLFPVETGMVESIARPGGNLTGVMVNGSIPKALGYFLMARPGVRNLYVPVKSGRNMTLCLEELRATADKLGIRITTANVETPKDLQQAMDQIPEDTDAVWLLHSPFLVSHIDIIVKAALDRKLPSGTSTSQFRNGILVSYGQDLAHTGRQAARLAHKVLQGISTSNLPVESAEFYLGLNLRTAAAIGLELPDELLQQADFLVR